MCYFKYIHRNKRPNNHITKQHLFYLRFTACFSFLVSSVIVSKFWSNVNLQFAFKAGNMSCAKCHWSCIETCKRTMLLLLLLLSLLLLLLFILPNSIQWDIRLFTHIKNVIENGYNEDASSIKRNFVHIETIAFNLQSDTLLYHCHFNSITQWQLCISHHCTQLLTLTAHQQGPSLFLVSCGSAGSVIVIS
jgi:hypothetical protein